MGEWLLSRRDRLIVAGTSMCLARLSAARRALQFGHLKIGFHFVPEGHAISPHQRNPVKGTTACPKSAPNYPLLSLRPPVQIFLDYFCRPRSEFRRPWDAVPRGPGTRR